MEEILIPNDSQHDVATYTLLVDGTAVSPDYQILSITVTKEINRIPMARIILRDGEAADKTFAISDEDLFVPGKSMVIRIGRDGDNQQVFKGIITRHAIKIKENGNGELHIECRDDAMRMTLGRHSRYFEQVKDSEVYDDLISKYGLSSDTQATTLTHKELVQHHLSDWDFMLLRAEANSMLVNVDDGKVTIKKPDTSAAPVLQVSYGSSVLEFEADIDARRQWKNVAARSWDYSNQQVFQADTDSVSFSEHGNLSGQDLSAAMKQLPFELHHSGHRLEQELQDWVNGTMLKSRMSKIRGRARFSGFSTIKPGDMVKLDGVGNRFKGNAFVTAVRQELGKGMWDTHIQFGLDPTPYAFVHNDMNDAPAAGLAGGISGLQIGVVVQLENDPDGQDRILVRIPMIDNDAQGIWTRVASLDAGKDRGAFFRPEIGDEVIVGFINDDPRDAVVLGMLHSSAKPAPIKAQDANNEKGFTTRSKMHISFNDDTKTISIDTPAGNKIVLDEAGQQITITDQNSNKVTMDSQGVSMESPMDIKLKAGGNLSLEAAASLSIKAASLSMQASADAQISGGASTKLSSSGITEITGSLVKIN
ncbi:type VI secretion system tip protein VgrG [Chitinophaga sancti]|uniref:type VI secretion system tip protein VgrG n=1 Tax=Chitinophaga sancti TaxID=1004 RepID=UPI002A7546D0|nr:type VI secretion system tip protein VgrG [Chitinophaga sancti]WPQ62260.1 type VI secretion system tip protein VgrG [Chitinophaga sancti]